MRWWLDKLEKKLMISLFLRFQKMEDQLCKVRPFTERVIQSNPNLTRANKLCIDEQMMASAGFCEWIRQRLGGQQGWRCLSLQLTVTPCTHEREVLRGSQESGVHLAESAPGRRRLISARYFTSAGLFNMLGPSRIWTKTKINIVQIMQRMQGCLVVFWIKKKEAHERWW